ncbi:MAG: RHS repeat protein [Caulobacter sp.]|nr:RHS repeat protein [Caulobacter sp.]
MDRRRRAAVGLALAMGIALAATGSASAATVKYGYDALGRLVTVDYGDGKVVTYTYDAAGNRTSVTTVGATARFVVLPLLGGYVMPLP